MARRSDCQAGSAGLEMFNTIGISHWQAYPYDRLKYVVGYDIWILDFVDNFLV